MVLAVFTATSVTSSRAHAWGAIAHGAVGYIAELNLTPAAKAMVYQLVGPEPLAVSATWPDEVRSDDRFRPFSDFHFFEIPNGYTFATLPDNLRAQRDTQTIVEQVPLLLPRRDLSPQQKMVLFRYLVHVVGDIHQPLHIGNGVDVGGNFCYVKWQDPKTSLVETVPLHVVWDERIIQNIAAEFRAANPSPNGTDRYFGYRELGDMILAQAGPLEVSNQQKAAVSTNVATWYDDARALHSAVYPDPTPVQNPADRPYCKIIDPATHKIVNGHYDPAKIPVLSPPYIKNSTAIAKKQILLAGIRLADLLNRTAVNYKAPAGWSDAAANLELSKILLHNIPKTQMMRQPQSKSETKRVKKSKKKADAKAGSNKIEPSTETDTETQWRAPLPYPEED
jgi:hypothetical protein